MEIIQTFMDLEQRWTAIQELNQPQSFFFTYQFLSSWWTVFGTPEKKLTICTTEQALAPLYQQKNKLYFVGRPHSDYSDILGTVEAKQQLLKELLVYCQENKLTLVLDQIPETSSTIALVKKLPHTAQIQCPTMIIKGHEQEIAADQLKKKSLKRHFNHFSKSGELICQHYTESIEISPHLDKFFDQHVARWQGTDSPSLFIEEKNRELYRTLVKNCASTKLILFTIISWNNQIIAYHLGFSQNNIFTWYKPTYDPALRDRSPGEVLIKYLLEYAYNNQYAEFDFTRGNEGFKLRFANAVRINYFVSNKYGIDYWKVVLAREVKKYPKVESLVRKFL